MGATNADDAERLVSKWAGASGSERANYQLFVADLCRLLGAPEPDPARDDTRDNAYVFERRVTFAHGDGSTSAGFIDCYRRGAFVLEAKKVKVAVHTKGFDDALMRARAQAESYARALPAAEGRPPFLVVVDVGHVIELYAEFTRSGATYTPFPDARSHRITLADLRDEAVRERLRLLWTDPMALDPSRSSAKVTRLVSDQLAKLARSLEDAGHRPESVAAFLTRCLFSMFAEDVGLLPKDAEGRGAFAGLLRKWSDQPDTLRQMLAVLWTDMDRGGFSPALAATVLRFNGKLFKGAGAADYVLPLTRDQIDDLLAAASSNWREVEPSIFGTLLERALDVNERHALGAHYTPRAYVERLVLPTVVEPLRAEWSDAQAAALLLSIEARDLEGKKREDKLAEARATVKAFHHRLCTVRVLDPACGSGNFLYVTLEHLKRLEGEVLDQLHALGDSQIRLGLEGETVSPQQLLGIEINERAAALAELVLWIGYLQWHIRTFDNASVAEPVIHDYRNIECRDAVLTWDTQEPLRDEAGNLVTRWDGETTKVHPVTGAKVPDDRAIVPQWRYVNPRPAEWPAADFIVGNPPFIGSKRMRAALGDGYVDAVQAAWPEIPEATDFVMRWWHHAALLVRAGKARRFGLITTNTLRQTYVRRAVEPHLAGENPLSIVFAIPDHPWVDSADGAAVRIAMTVGEPGAAPGRLLEVMAEHESGGESDDIVVSFSEAAGRITADLRVGADLTRARPLRANLGLCSVGMKTIGKAFQIEHELALSLGLGTVPGLDHHIRPYINGRDLLAERRGKWVMDFFGLDEDEVRRRFPAAYQHLLDGAKPERDLNRNVVFRRLWWVIGHPRPQFRAASAGLSRYIATVETSKHRIFAFLPATDVPDSTIVTIALDDALALGVLASAVHVEWALATGGRLGVGNDPRYNKTRCFETFPFPDLAGPGGAAAAARIRDLAEQIDAHCKARQAEHPGLSLTGIHNAMQARRLGVLADRRDQEADAKGLAGVLLRLHDELDAAVLSAYGWEDLAPDLAAWAAEDRGRRETAVGELLQRLVDLNARRVAEEAAGNVRWLRPEFQNPAAAPAAVQAELAVEPEDDETPAVAAAPVVKRPWPSGLPEQIKAVSDVLGSAGRPLGLEDLAAHFAGRGRWRDRLPTIVGTLEAIGRVRRQHDQSETWIAN